MRSSLHARAGLLGSFYADDLFVQNLRPPWATAAIITLVFHPAIHHRGPNGHGSVATSSTRATELSAALLTFHGRGARPEAEALTITCTASSSPARGGEPTAAVATPEASTAHRAPAPALPLGGTPPTLALGVDARLPARFEAGRNCQLASAGASSQRGGGGGGRMKDAGEGVCRSTRGGRSPAVLGLTSKVRL